MTARALHYVFKIGDRKASYEFFTKVLRMKVLRHEEFEEGCKAECNGPYNGKWSKTMVGYGSEDDHFVIELTYNYEIGSYRLGNDFMGMFIESDDLHKSLEGHANAKKLECGKLQITDPDGHWFLICPGKGSPKVVKVSVRVQDVKKSVDYWTNQLGMKVVEERDGGRTTMSFGEGQITVPVLQQIVKIYFQLSELQEKIKAAKLPILKELTTLDTPGKASVQVVILADPDKHEICFVGDKGFRELSKVDPKADELIRKEIEKDDSVSWFKDGKKKV
ncbi:glyoxalase family protein [Teladorsagia circumcincta]|uniref:Glyoxalase family protein n=1 Tax=Teladorsagia circumcincta TaxID=45464 RepID=A0A2G9TN18_TELCI|nr:glyoxalase family protein [Teladorsagia circumcincta]